MEVSWYGHQTDALNFTRQRLFTMLAMETGTGKTPVGLQMGEWWLDDGLTPGLIVCPNSLTGTWVAEAEKFKVKHRVIRLEGSSLVRKQQLAAAHILYDVVVVNYESVRILKDELLAIGFKWVIFDEIQKLKDRRAKQTISCREIAARTKRRVGLSGTPIVHSPLDVWSEYDVLDPQRTIAHPLGYGSFSNMEKQIAIVTPHPRLGMRARKLDFIPEKVKELGQRMSRHTFEARKSDCLDLPDRLFVPVYLDMQPEQARVYRDLTRHSVAYLEKTPANSGDITEFDVDKFLENRSSVAEYEVDKRRVSAKLVVTLLTRHHQVTSGFVKTDEGKEITIGSSKIDWLEEKLPLLVTPTHKCIIIALYTHDVHMLQELCKTMDIGYVTLNGETSHDAQHFTHQFQTDENIRVLIGQIQTTANGHTLTAADSMVFYSSSFAAGDREQVVDRVYRIGQTRKVTYYSLLERNSVDVSIERNLQAKKDLAEMTIAELKRAINGESTLS